jgi:DNA-binding SARP family transcriptional activator
MSALRLSLLQSFHITLAEKPVTSFRSTKERALLAYLAVESDRPHRRDVLAGLLWPDAPEATARHNLGQTLVNLRTAIGDRIADPPVLLITRQTIQLNPAANCWVDVVAFLEHLAACQAHTHADPARCSACVRYLRSAADLYRGPFLAEFFLADSDLFEEWVALKREWLHQQALDALQCLTVSYEWQRDYAQAIQAARRQVALDSLREEAHRSLMRVLALGGQRGAALAQYETCRHMLEEELGVEPAEETTALNEQIRTNQLQIADCRLQTEPDNLQSAISNLQFQDWGRAPEGRMFYGRRSELAQLERWIVADRCRLVAILGMGGMGKTILASKLARALADQFDGIIWRSLHNAPPLDTIVRSCLQALSIQHSTDLPDSADERLLLLIDALRRRRCLIVLDNLESIMEGGGRAGQYRPGYEDYGQLIRWVSETEHQSCLLLTSREKPHELTRLEFELGPARALQLAGLDVDAGWNLLKTRCHFCQEDAVATLIDRYSGNPLALQLVSETIEELFDGDIDAFLQAATPIFDDIRDVLDQQFARLSALEQEVLFWLAIERDPITLRTLEADIVHLTRQRALLEAVRSLQRRSLLETSGDGFTLQHVVLEYVTDRLIEEIFQEI